MTARGLSRGAVAVVTTGLILGLVALPAGAQPDLASAQARAKTLAKQVQQLEVRTEIATENFNAINDKLQTVVNQMTLAEQDVDAAKAGARSEDDVAQGRVRALYMSGGSVALYATVLDSGSIGDMLNRVDTVNAIVDSDRVDAQQSWSTVRKAEKARKKLGALALERTRLQDKADVARTTVEQLLGQRRTQLAAANSTVRRLAQEYAERKAREAAEAARVRLLDLGVLGNLPAGNPYAERAIAAARSKVGSPYVWGATGPTTFDCSGLTQWSYAQAGLGVNRTSRQQWFNGQQVPLSDLRPGDLLFWAYDVAQPGTIHHVAMYIGGGRMIEAPRTGLDVREVPVYLDGFIGAVRPGARLIHVPSSGAYASAVPSRMNPGDLVDGRYRIDAVLDNTRDWTQVWFGEDTLLLRPVTVRVLDPIDPRTPAVIEAARAAATIDHGGFVRVLDIDDAPQPDADAAGDDHQTPAAHIVSSYVAGELLVDVLVDGPLDPIEAADLIADLADSIAVAHDHHLVHGVLDPVHVVVAPGGEVAVVELGVAALLRSGDGSTGDGSEGPDRVDGLDDVRHLGGLLYACLTGRWPLADSCGLPPAERDKGFALPPRRARANVPGALDRICRRALGEDVGNEPGLDSARELAAALRSWLGRSGTSASERMERRTTSTGPVSTIGSSRTDPARRAIVGLLILALVLLVGGVAFLGFQVLDSVFGEPGGSPPPGPSSSSSTSSTP